MNNLLKLQTVFQNHLLLGDLAIESDVLVTDSIPVTTRLTIYKEAYHARLVEALAANYPCLQHYMGHDVFYAMGVEYSKTYPSSEPSIRWFGHKLGLFLETYLESKWHFLVELADFEWKMTLAFDAADASLFTLDKAATLPPEAWQNMNLKFHPSMKQLKTYWKIIPLWEALANQEESVATPVKEENAESWIIWRVDNVNRFYMMTDPETWAINRGIEGHNFAELCEGLCQWYSEDQIGMEAASLLKNWIQAGLIIDILY